MDVGAEPGQGQRAPPGSHVRATLVAGELPPGKVPGPLHHQRCHHRASCEPREQPERWRVGGHRHTPQRGSNLATRTWKHRKSTRRSGQTMGLGCRAGRQAHTRRQCPRPGVGRPSPAPPQPTSPRHPHPGGSHLSPEPPETPACPSHHPPGFGPE